VGYHKSEQTNSNPARAVGAPCLDSQTWDNTSPYGMLFKAGTNRQAHFALSPNNLVARKLITTTFVKLKETAQ
jgi:hypothetical protein